MDKERIKTWVLVGLVLLSFAFTTQLWLSVPLERIISTSQTHSGQDSIKDYDLSSFVLPQWIVVNFGGGSHTKLINDSSNRRLFGDIYDGVSLIMKHIFAGEQEIEFVPVEMEELDAARGSRSIEVEYKGSFDTALFEEVYGGGKNRDGFPFVGIKAVIISPGSDGEIFICDGKSQAVFKTVLSTSGTGLDRLVKELEENDPVKYWTLREIGYSDNDKFYVPLEMGSFSLPAGTAVKEIDVSDQQLVDMYASDFFSDMSMVRKITEMNGSIIYTDGQNALLRINSGGSLEYLSYSYVGGDSGSTDIISAIHTAISFIEEHGGIPEQLFLEEMLEVAENSHRGYRFKFNYAYNGLPFFRKGALEASAVEVTVVEGRVVKYYRNIHQITRARIVQMPLLYPVEAADVVAGIIRGPGDAKVSPDILDMYLGYCIDIEEVRDYQIFPVWYIKTEEREFLVDAYRGQLVE
jgi:regulatory protein YycH of two-component signal transduction system YycFG